MRMEAPPETAARAVAKPAIADVLREGIRQGMLAPGQPLIQASIAEAMGVSRIPVREALHALASEGLVTFGEDGGARVTALAPEEVDELWTLRALIESHMAAPIAGNATPADVERLRALVASMEGADHATWSERNFAFHQDLHALSGLPHFADVAGRVLTMIEPYSRVAVSVLDAQDEAQAEHRGMVDAIAAGDGDALAGLLLHHSNRARQALLEYSAAQQREADQRLTATEAARSLADHLGQ